MSGKAPERRAERASGLAFSHHASRSGERPEGAPTGNPSASECDQKIQMAVRKPLSWAGPTWVSGTTSRARAIAPTTSATTIDSADQAITSTITNSPVFTS